MHAHLAPPSDASSMLDHVGPGTRVIVPTANGEPVTLLDALEEAADRLEQVQVHQVLPLHDRPHHAGEFGDRLRHVSYFLSASLRPHFEAGHVDLVPNDLSRIPSLVRSLPGPKLLVASASLPDEHGFVSLGVAGGYAAALAAELPLFVEVNRQMPRTAGRNQVHLSRVLGWCEADYPLVAVDPPPATDIDRSIAGHVAERIEDGATLQIGVGTVPDAVAGLLSDHRDLGIHTELFADGLASLVRCGAATGVHKSTGRCQATTSDALGSAELYRFLDDNRAVVFWPCEDTNDVRVIASQPRFVAVNATMQVDLLGQCASESLGTHYISSSGGQADFMRGAALSEGGKSFIVTHATAHDVASGTTVSRIVPTLTPGAVVTTHKNVVDHVVTEHGVAELRGRTIAERARALIRIAAPEHRDGLTAAARELGYLH